MEELTYREVDSESDSENKFGDLESDEKFEAFGEIFEAETTNQSEGDDQQSQTDEEFYQDAVLDEDEWWLRL